MNLYTHEQSVSAFLLACQHTYNLNIKKSKESKREKTN